MNAKEWDREAALRAANRWTDRSDHTCMFEGRRGCAACQRPMSVADLYPGDTPDWARQRAARTRARRG